jgi:hypothetical protein
MKIFSLYIFWRLKVQGPSVWSLVRGPLVISQYAKAEVEMAAYRRDKSCEVESLSQYTLGETNSFMCPALIPSKMVAP